MITKHISDGYKSHERNDTKLGVTAWPGRVVVAPSDQVHGKATLRKWVWGRCEGKVF